MYRTISNGLNVYSNELLDEIEIPDDHVDDDVNEIESDGANIHIADEDDEEFDDHRARRRREHRDDEL